MADFPIMPVGTSDFLADTAHLSDEEMGLYWRMCLQLWRMPERRFPNDDGWLAKRFGRDAAQVRALVDEFFVSTGNWIKHKRIEREFERVSESCRKQSARAKSRWNKGNGTSRGNAGPAIPSTSTSSSLRSEEKESSPIGEPKKAAASAAPSDQITGLFDGDEPARPETPPKPKRGRLARDGPAARIPADWQVSETNWAWCRREDFNDGFTRQQAEGFRDHWLAADGPNARKRDWDAAFRTWMRRSRDNGRGLPPHAANGAGRPAGRPAGPTGYAATAARVLHRRGEVH